MTAPTLEAEATNGEPPPANRSRTATPSPAGRQAASRGFYREAGNAVRVLVGTLDRDAPAAVKADPVWRDTVARARSAGMDDFERPAVILALTYLFDPGIVIEAVAEAFAEVPA
jgi:hypothetical protein